MGNYRTLVRLGCVVIMAMLSGISVKSNWDGILDLEGSPVIEWDKQNEVQKAKYLELYHYALNYCRQNIGRRPKELNYSVIGPRVVIFPKVTLETIAVLYREYGDLQKAAKTKFQHWSDSKGKPELLNADEDPMGYVVFGYEEAEMYTDMAAFYSKAYKEKMKWLSQSTDIKLLKSNFGEYKLNWPSHANDYQEFMHNWSRAKKLAKTTKSKPLDPAVQHHEWFYSEKREEVIKALEYYNKHNVVFMLEKALKHKDPAVAAKAKEYLDGLGKVQNNAEKVK